MTPEVSGGRPIARFRVLGFPVTVDISFVIVVALIGWVPGDPLTNVVVWVVLAAVAVLLHELGHAVVARTTGAQPVITLAGLGGLTSYLPPAPLSRARAIAVAVAGPAVGIVLGVPLLLVALSVTPASDLWATVLQYAWFTTLGWSVLNLLPVLPLDGGQVLRELLPGDRVVRERRAAVVSIVVAAALGLLGWRAGYVFAPVMAVLLVVVNVLTLRRPDDGSRDGDLSEQVAQLLWAGRAADARELAHAHPDDLAPTLRDVLAAVDGSGAAPSEDSPWGPAPASPDASPERSSDPSSDRSSDLSADRPSEPPTGPGARARLAAAAEHPSNPTGSTLLLLVDRVRRDWPSAARTIRTAPAVGSAAVIAVQNAAHAEGGDLAGAEVGQAYLDRPGPSAFDGPGHAAHIAYNTACSWAGVGELDKGLAAFRRAADLGFADLTAVDSDPDLAPLRPLPGYDEARSVIRSQALAGAGGTAPT